MWILNDLVIFHFLLFSGDVVLPGRSEYCNGSSMHNLRFQARFGGVVYAESIRKSTANGVVK